MVFVCFCVCLCFFCVFFFAIFSDRQLSKLTFTSSFKDIKILQPFQKRVLLYNERIHSQGKGTCSCRVVPSVTGSK